MSHIAYEIFETLTAFFAILGNGILISLFYRKKEIRILPNYPIISLSAADFFIGLVGIPLAILVRLRKKRVISFIFSKV